MVFVKGDPNINRAGRPKRKTLTELIHAKLDSPDSPLTWDQLVMILLEMVKRKDKDMIKTLWQFTDGMPKQSTDVTSGGKPLPTPIYAGKSTETDI